MKSVREAGLRSEFHVYGVVNMKLNQICLIISLVLLALFFIETTEAKAMSTGFSTEELSEKEKTTFLSNVRIIPLAEEPEKRGVDCFDVNEQGLIAIVQSSLSEDEVCVYTSQGDFLYGYALDGYQDHGVEWGEQNINIYFVRTDVIASIDPEGNILDVKEVPDSLEENQKYSRDVLNSKKRVIGDTTYLIRNDLGILNLLALSYSQIVVKDSTGTESIVYDMNSRQLANIILTVSVACIFVSIVITIVTKEVKKISTPPVKRY